MPNTTLPLASVTPLPISTTSNQHSTDHDTSKYRLTKTIYAVGINPTISPKEQVSQLQSTHPDIVKAVAELESYLADPEFRQSKWFLRFFGRLRSKLEKLNSLANEYQKTQMANEFIDELINEGYIRCLRSMAVPSGPAYIAFSKSYAATHNMPLAAAMLFSPNGGARMALRYFLTAEKSHGQHRPMSSTACISEDSQENWFAAGRTINWPTVVNTHGSEELLDVDETQGKLPDGFVDTMHNFWRRKPALRNYTGTNRLSGNTPFRIVEDAIDLVFRGGVTPAVIKVRYDRIVETANRQGIDPFYAVYKQLFSQKDQLQPYWDTARTMLYEYSRMLWEKQNKTWLLDGTRNAAEGVTCRPMKKSTRKPLKQSLPGTIYLNNGRYYWVVRNKMKPVALVDDHNKRSLPGTIGNCQGRYFWVVPGVLKRQRLVAEGQQFSTTDRATAEKIALQLWERIQEKRPKLAAKIKARRAWGTATKDKTLATKIARKLWKQMQHENPQLAAKILTDNRPTPKDHWIAQICIGGNHRHIGSFNTRKEAMAAYTQEFEKAFGYPPGYNVQAIPKLDKVWPSWQEEKQRLERINVKPVMPVIGLADQAKPLLPVIKRMQKVDWLVKNCMVVFDDDLPAANQDVTVESRGQNWLCEIKQQGKRPVLYGSTVMDADSGRIRITLFSPAYHNAAILAEEIYHIVYRIIGHTRSLFAAQIRSWHQGRMQAGSDPTLSEDEAFALAMAQEDCRRAHTNLPRRVVRYARKIFSTDNAVSDRVMQEIMTG